MVSVKSQIDILRSNISILEEALDTEIQQVKFTTNTQINDMNNQILLLQTQNKGLMDMNKMLIQDKLRLQRQIQDLEEDHRNFTKVSKIIALENENAKMKEELNSFINKGNVSRTIKNVQDNTSQTDVEEVTIKVQDNVSQTDAEEITTKVQDNTSQTDVKEVMTKVQDELQREEVSLPQQIEEEPNKDESEEELEDIKVTEKKIGRIIYYVDENKKIYEKLKDGSIGNEIGRLVKIDGRTKLVKNTDTN